MTRSHLSILAFAVLAVLYLRENANFCHASSNARSINILNQSGKRVEIYWIHADTGELMLQSTPFVYNGATFNLNSFVGHSFQVRELASSSTGQCGDDDEVGTCRTDVFTVNENDSQTFYIEKGIHMVQRDNLSLAYESASELLSKCQVDAIQRLELGDDGKSVVQDLIACVEVNVADEILQANEEISYQARIRKTMGESLENHTCAEEDLVTSEALRTEPWILNGQYRRVDILHDHFDSQIHLIDNFIDPEECAAMEEAAERTLHRATVADGKGGSELSPSRKAMQAGITVPWHLESQGNKIASVSRKVYEYVNHALDLDINEDGQEDLMSIQYFGRGEDDKEPDRYMPHCDGQCDGLEFKSGNRMATVVMYCTIPTRGGATNFRNSNVHIAPKSGSAVFFSYIDPDTMKTDSGFSEHSGCPVLEGEKKIVTQWIRLGVDRENPWDSFNTLGIKVSEEAD